MNVFVQILSIAGAGLILLGFLCLQRGWWKSHERLYLWVNIIGALLLTVVAVHDRQAGFIVLEVTWTLVSFWGLVRPLPPPPPTPPAAVPQPGHP